MTEFRKVLIRFDVMRLKDASAFAALLTGVVVALDNRNAPFFVFCPLPVEVALSCFRLVFALVVRFGVALIHCLFVGGLSVVSRKPSGTSLGDFFSAFWRCVGALPAAILLFCALRFEYLTAIWACPDHGSTPKKIPCLRRWLLLSRQLAPVREQGILNDYTPTELVLQAA